MELERTEYVKVGTQHALLRRVVEAAEIDTVVDTRLVVDSSTTTPAQGPREQRDRDDEHPRGVQRARRARCASSSSSPRPTSTAPSRTTRPSSTRRWAARTRRARRSSATSSRPRRRWRSSPTRTPTSSVTHPALRQRARARRAHLAHRPVLAARGADDPRLRPALPVRARGRRGARARARGPAAAAGRLQRGGRRRARAVRGGGPAGQALRAGAAALGHRAGGGRSRAGSGSQIPPEMLNQLRFGRGVDNRRLKAAGLRVRLHQPRGRDRRSASTCACIRCCARAPSPTATSARSRSSCAGARTCATRACATAGASPASRCSSSSGCWPATAARARRGRPGARPAGARAQAPAAAPPEPPPEAAEPAGPPVDHYDDLAAEEIISLLGSLEPADLEALRDYERDHRAREAVVGAIESVLARAAGPRIGRVSATFATPVAGRPRPWETADTSLHFLVAHRHRPGLPLHAKQVIHRRRRRWSRS